MKKNTLSLCLVLCSVLLASTSLALPIDFYNKDDNLSSSGSNGTMSADTAFTDYYFSFTLASDVNLNDVNLLLNLVSFDHNFSISINGTVIVPMQADGHNPAWFAPSVASPWSENSNDLPRVSVGMSNQSVDFEASLSASSTVMTPVTYLSQTVSLPSFVLGQNSIVLTNPNGVGPDGIDFTLSGDDGRSPVPEPSTMILFGAGLVGLAGINLKRREKNKHL